MKKTILLILMCTVSYLVIGCNFIEEQKAERIIKKYYQAIIDEDYEKAYEQLHLYDTTFNEGTKLTNDETKEHYFKKVEVLKDQGYKLNHFEIMEVEYEDGHSFWHHIKLEVEQNEQTFEWNEVADIYEGKLLLGSSDDPLFKYRHGKMNFDYE